MSDKKCILVVDDAPANIDLLVGLLSDDYKVKVALNGEKAVKLAIQSKKAPDLMLLDVVMPGMDGYEVCRQVKADPAGASLPIILVSGNDSSEEKAEGVAAGADGFVAKPVDPSVLTAEISKFL